MASDDERELFQWHHDRLKAMEEWCRRQEEWCSEMHQEFEHLRLILVNIGFSASSAEAPVLKPPPAPPAATDEVDQGE